MKMTKAQCPYCGSPIDSDLTDRNYIFCSYCGSKVFIDNDTKNINIKKDIHINKCVNVSEHYVDDAVFLKAQNEEKENKRTWIFLMIALVCLLLFIFGNTVKNHMNEQDALETGKIAAGFYRDYLDKDCHAVEEHLKAAGFTNIKFVDLNDSGLRFWKNEKVESVSIAGNTTFDSYHYFSPDSIVIISYH